MDMKMPHIHSCGILYFAPSNLFFSLRYMIIASVHAQMMVNIPVSLTKYMR